MNLTPRFFAGVFSIGLLLLAGCGPDPMTPEEQEKSVSQIAGQLQELGTRTHAVIDFPEYNILLREIDGAYSKITRRLDRATGEKVEFAIAPFHAACNDWMSFNQGKLQAPDNNIFPVLEGHWKIGRERALDLAREYPPRR